MSKILIISLFLAGCAGAPLRDVTSQEKGPKKCYDPMPILICETRGESIFCRCHKVQTRIDRHADPITDDY